VRKRIKYVTIGENSDTTYVYLAPSADVLTKSLQDRVLARTELQDHIIAALIQRVPELQRTAEPRGSARRQEERG
jgi:hypothetical protein